MVDVLKAGESEVIDDGHVKQEGSGGPGLVTEVLLVKIPSRSLRGYKSSPRLNMWLNLKHEDGGKAIETGKAIKQLVSNLI